MYFEEINAKMKEIRSQNRAYISNMVYSKLEKEKDYSVVCHKSAMAVLNEEKYRTSALFIAADENAFTGIVPQEGILQCLISQTVDVKSGQSATVVITATTRNDVLILPLSVIAGRQSTGLVTVITPNGERVETKVTLGVTDGANIEILSGLEEGDVVSATPPNLDPRGI